MRIIEIKALENGAHNNLKGEFKKLFDGWAIIPDDMVIPRTFPFVNIETAEETRYNDVKHIDAETGEMVTERVSYTVTVVTSMTAGVMPEPEPEPIAEPSTDDVLNILLGVD